MKDLVLDVSGAQLVPLIIVVGFFLRVGWMVHAWLVALVDASTTALYRGLKAWRFQVKNERLRRDYLTKHALVNYNIKRKRGESNGDLYERMREAEGKVPR